MNVLSADQKKMDTKYLEIILQLLTAELADAMTAVDTAKAQLASVAALTEKIKNRVRTYHA